MRAALYPGVQQSIAKLKIISKDGRARHLFAGIFAGLVLADRTWVFLGAWSLAWLNSSWQLP